MQTITPFLWFDGNLEDAVNLYTSIFKDSIVTNISRHGDQVFTASFELQGQKFMGLNGGPMFKFTEAVSFLISCETQNEVDFLWNALSEGGEIQQCGWLKDKFGLSWQVIPTALMRLMGNENPAKSQAVMNAMLHMKKIDIAGLQEAYDHA
jgi:predicted 3-demethylubiquinone-9 3-methyltransferase (glyoxalase superfamily)